MIYIYIDICIAVALAMALGNFSSHFSISHCGLVGPRNLGEEHRPM